MGRPRKPNHLKILDGDQPCRINREEPVSPPGLGDPPAWFDDLSKQAWARLSAIMGDMGVATRADTEAATLYCRAYSMWMRASAAVAKDGMTVKTDGGAAKLNPLIQVVNESSRTMVRLLAQFGMTPASRSALHVPKAAEEDDVMDYFRPKAANDGKRRP